MFNGEKMKKKARKQIKKKAKSNKSTTVRKKSRVAEIFIPHSPKNEKTAWTKRPELVRWSDVQRPSNLRNPSLPPGFQESLCFAPGRIDAPKPAVGVKKKNTEQK